MNVTSKFVLAMERTPRFLSCLITIVALMVSCENEKVVPKAPQHDPDLVRVGAKLEQAGFDTSEGFRKFRDGYIFENDIFMTEPMIDKYLQEFPASEAGRTQQYRTNNLVTGTNRTLSIFMATSFGTYMQNAFDNALARYNALNLGLRLQRATSQSGADISILAFYEVSNTLGFSAGFPANGNPATPISLNTYYYNNNTARPDAATVIAHEIGHAIGFRHTDYMNRTFSCGSGGDEGAAGVGANHIPGTPTAPEANSWMLACSNNTNRPFTNYDQTALLTVYARLAGPYSSVTKGTYSSITGPDTSCPVQVANYSYTWNNYNMMIPKGATLTVSGGVFLPSGSTTLNLAWQVGTTNFQVQWNGAGSITAVGRWESGATPPPRQQYQEVITKYVAVNCQ